MRAAHASTLRREAAPAPLRVQTVSLDPDFDRLEGDWEELAGRARLDHPFLTWPWIRSWWEAWGPGASLHVVVVRRGREALAIAPLMIVERRIFGIRARCLELMANPHSPRSGILVAHGAEEATEALWRHVASEGDRWDLLVLNQVPAGSTTEETLWRFAAESGCPTGVWESSRSPFVRLAGDWNSYWNGLDAKHRSNVRNRLGRLRRQGEPRLETVTGGAALGAALEEGLLLEAAAWKEARGTAILSEPGASRFYRSLAGCASRRGWLRLHFVEAGGRRVAFQYGLAFDGRFFLLKPGYDPAYRHCSPGTVAAFLAIRNAYEEGMEEFDFTGESDPWKLRWTRSVRPHCWRWIFQRGARPRLIHAAKFRIAPRLRRLGSALPSRSADGGARE